MIKKLQKKVFLAAIFCFQGITMLHAQSTEQQIAANLTNDQRVKVFTMEPNLGTPSLITMKSTGSTLSLNDTPAFLQAVLGLSQGTTFVKENTINSNGIQIDKFQQYNNGIKVEHGVFKAISSKNLVQGFTAEFYNLPSMSINPGLSESAALQKALNHVGATTYAWDYIQSLGNSPEITAAYNEVYPKGELVIVDNYMTPAADLTLAYKFNVYAAEPLSRAYIYVDATNGEILLLDAIIKHAEALNGKEEVTKTIKAPGTIIANPSTNTFKMVPFPAAYTAATGETRYAGNRTFQTSKNANGFWELKGISPSGISNETKSYRGLGGAPISVPGLSDLTVSIFDGDSSALYNETADNSWTSAEHKKNNFSATSRYPVANEFNNDDIALDAHWGAEVVLDYWKNIHNRSSYDNKGTKIINYVHYGDAYDNAFWNGSAMTYGDGSYQGGTKPNGSFGPLTSMDVCAHEIGHGVCQFTANLVYQRESGAMNEGFSDIWAASVENYVLTKIDGTLPYDPWGIGEQIDERDLGVGPGQATTRALRWMDDPKAATAPDSYGGLNWKEPECGTPTLANDQCGVHTNSGVLNKWYYLMVTGSGKALSLGKNKKPSDDQITDKGNAYKVLSIGYDKADNITYLAETMLAPNAKFANMRAASILAAQVLYGIASNEEKQVTNAWHAVDIGNAYAAGVPNTIVFSTSNNQILSENNQIDGCSDVNTYDIVITGNQVSPSATISFSIAGSTATLGQDFTLSNQSLTFSGTETKTLKITANDDALIENNETIVLSYLYNGKLEKQVFTIVDNDFVPRTGKNIFELLPTETFSQVGLPSGWSTVLIDTAGTNVWAINGASSGAGRAFITDGLTNTTFYNSNVPSNTILRSPVLNANGASNVTVSFDWEAGGERDAAEENSIFDFGEFVYSTDGATYISVQKFVGTAPIGAVNTSGKYTGIINQLDGQSFYIGWRWFNDSNAGSPFSFAIDNVVVSAKPAGIETQIGEHATATLYAGNSIYFISTTDNALIAKVENASADLGCVTLSVIDEGTTAKTFSSIATTRTAKAYAINTANAEATYDLTVYYTNEELSAFNNASALIPMKVNSSNIDDANDKAKNFTLNGVLTDVNTLGQFRAYTGKFKGSGSVTLVNNFIYCTDAPAPWISGTVGTTNTGSVCYKGGNFEVTASGSGFNDSRIDSFNFTYQQLIGNGEIIAKVTSLNNTNRAARAGVMIRGSLDKSAMFAMTSIASNPNLTGTAVNFESRKADGDKSKISGFTTCILPNYIRVVRNGSTVTSYTSSTNGNWVQLGTNIVNFGETVLIGLASTSNLDGVNTVANYTDVTIISGSGMAKSTTTKSALNPLIDEDSDENSVTIYPNPAVNSLSIELSDSTVESIAIYNFLGKVVRVENLKSPNKSANIDVSDFSKGLYLLKINTTDGRSINKSFLKE
ncbi:M4 family metallopeptidase [Flavobacterium sp. LB2P6]|uniref:M4 family metallopeptidase n=1 Tax=Flavobacterium sp. LB2P6 TaxID=3401714 RepID=UPI003AAD835A